MSFHVPSCFFECFLLWIRPSHGRPEESYSTGPAAEIVVTGEALFGAAVGTGGTNTGGTDDVVMAVLVTVLDCGAFATELTGPAGGATGNGGMGCAVGAEMGLVLYGALGAGGAGGKGTTLLRAALGAGCVTVPAGAAGASPETSSCGISPASIKIAAAAARYCAGPSWAESISIRMGFLE